MSERAVSFDAVPPAAVVDEAAASVHDIAAHRLIKENGATATSWCLGMLVKDMGIAGKMIDDYGEDHFDGPGDDHAELMREGDDRRVLVSHPKGQLVASCLFSSTWTISHTSEALNYVVVPSLDSDALSDERERLIINFGYESGRLAVAGGLDASQRQRILAVDSMVLNLISDLEDY